MTYQVRDTDVITLSWGDMKQVFLESWRNGRVEPYFKRSGNANHMRQIIQRAQTTSRSSKWTGGQNATETIEYVVNGYSLPGFEINDSDLHPLRERRQIIMSDTEGEYHHDLFISGQDEYYSQMQFADKQLAVDIEATVTFAARDSSQAITAYKEWLLGALADLEVTGVDYGLDMVYHTVGSYGYNRRDTNKTRNSKVLIAVKNINEASDSRDWGVLLSPGGFRHVGFTALIYGADQVNRTASATLGSPKASHEYYCRYDWKTDKIHIGNSTDGKPFSPKDMDEKFYNAIADAKAGVRE